MGLTDYTSELRGYLPTASPLLLAKLINRGWRDCLDASDWSFLEAFTVLQVPKVVTAGTISWTQFTNTIRGDATASAAWSPLLLGTPPFVCGVNSAGQPLIGTGGYQIQSLAGPLYSIVASDGGSPVMTLTVDRIISEASQSGVTYQALRALYGPPGPDWISWITITNTPEGYGIWGRRLNGSQKQLSLVDPQDSSTGDPYFMFSQFSDANGMPVRRLWPSPVTQVGLGAIYKRRGTDLSDTVDIPSNFPVQTLLERARMYAAQWKATQPREQSDTTDWNVQWKTHRDNYLGDPRRPGSGLIEAAEKIDSSLRTPPAIIRRGPGYYPWSGAFTASHDITRLNSAMAFFGGTW